VEGRAVVAGDGIPTLRGRPASQGHDDTDPALGRRPEGSYGAARAQAGRGRVRRALGASGRVTNRLVGTRASPTTSRPRPWSGWCVAGERWTNHAPGSTRRRPTSCATTGASAAASTRHAKGWGRRGSRRGPGRQVGGKDQEGPVRCTTSAGPAAGGHAMSDHGHQDPVEDLFAGEGEGIQPLHGDEARWADIVGSGRRAVGHRGEAGSGMPRPRRPLSCSSPR